MRIVLVLLALASLSCFEDEVADGGGSGGDGGGNNMADGGTTNGGADASSQSTCSFTLSGDVTATVPCSATAGKNDAEDFSIVAASSSQAAGSVSSLVFVASVDGEVTVKDYAPSALRTTAFMLMTTDNKVYAASLNIGDPQGTIGTLHITGLDAQTGQAGVKVWKPHGTMTATLVGTTAGGTVTLSASF